MPIGNVDDSITLGNSIKKKHDALVAGAGDSPLEGQVDMTLFDALLTSIKANRTPAVTDTQQKEAWNEQALTVIGIAAGQNLQVKNTVYWHINKVHKFLAFKYKGNEEQASLWGFNVVVSESSGRRYARFNIPYSSPQGLLDLSTNIISKHTGDAVASVLPPALIDMADMAAKNNQAIQLREDADTKSQNAQAGNELARNQCGYGEGQTSQTPDTLYWYFTQVRDLLLVAHEGNEEQLSTWGFNVVVSSSTSHGPGTNPTPPPPPEPTVINLDVGETTALMEIVSADEDIIIGVSGDTIELCVGNEETSSCNMSAASSILNNGDTFNGSIADLGLGTNGFLKATNIGAGNVQITFIREE